MADHPTKRLIEFAKLGSRRLRDLAEWVTFDRSIQTLTAAATVVAVIALLYTARQLVYTARQLEVATLQYQDQERTGRLERVHKFQEDAAKILDEEERKQLVVEFPERWEKDIQFCLSREEADSFLQAALDADRSSTNAKMESRNYRRYNLARKHLNAIETLAFPYYYNLADQELLARSACETMVRSNKYFRQLTEVFGLYLGGGQSWQVIPKAAEVMEREYNFCKQFSLPQDQQKQVHRLPKAREEPDKGEEPCRN